MSLSENEKICFDFIVDERYKNINICHQCGGHQWHYKIYCSICNGKYCNHRHTMREVITIIKNITYANGIYTHWASPKFLSARSRIYLRDKGFSERNFETYLQELWNS